MPVRNQNPADENGMIPGGEPVRYPHFEIGHRLFQQRYTYLARGTELQTGLGDLIHLPAAVRTAKQRLFAMFRPGNARTNSSERVKSS